MLESDTGQPVDAQVDVSRGVLQAGQVEPLATRRTGTDKYRLVVLVENFLEAGHLDVKGGVHPHIENVVDLLVQNLDGQAEGRDLAAHHAAAGELVVEDVDNVAQRREIAGHRQRCRPLQKKGRD